MIFSIEPIARQAFFTVCDPLYKRHATGIIENELCCFKVDTVLRPVDFVLRTIPFDPHVYLQYSTYDCQGPPKARRQKSQGTLRSAREFLVPVQASAQEHFDVGLVADPFIGGQASRPVEVAGGDSQHDFL